MVCKEINKCRICGNENLTLIIDLGDLYLTGVFPKDKSEPVGRGPLELVKCEEDREGKYCGLVQLRHNCELDQLYGDDYGYRSGLNKSMVNHLHNKVADIIKMIELSKGDLVVDIGSNDSTLLQAYPNTGLNLVGIDPTGEKFKEYYPDHIRLIPDFFPSPLFKKDYGDKKAKIITSISMFYDLEDPLLFVKNVHEALDDNGIWVFEQSYLPAMLEAVSYDTICHEHLEYYALKQICYMLDKVGLKINDIELNKINGGSFSIVASKINSRYHANDAAIRAVRLKEEKMELNSLAPFKKFKSGVDEHKIKLLEFIRHAKNQGKKIFGYGASTKGNVILQYCNITEKDVPYIAEVNEDKYGRYTPGTLIPIIDEIEAKKMNPYYFMVLPWHFKNSLIIKEKSYLEGGGHLFFPLPKLEVV